MIYGSHSRSSEQRVLTPAPAGGCQAPGATEARIRPTAELNELPAGASTPNQVPMSKPARPASSSVGTSGSADERWPVLTASARSLPLRTCCSTGVTVSNDIVHVADIFSTLSAIASAPVPDDRPIDGIDQTGFFCNPADKSKREGFVYYIKSELRAAKWRDWKMHMIWESEPNVGPTHLEAPRIFNIVCDPKEETDVANQYSWVRTPMRRLIHDFQESLKINPPIPSGAPDDYVPKAGKR
mgnify:CR=1 FL=1